MQSRSVIGALSLAMLFATASLLIEAAGERERFISHEVAFTDRSARGMEILPASCASNPSYYHGSLSSSGDGLGYVSATGQSEYGAYRNNVYVCITNTTGANYFIPANTATEMNAVKALGSSIPGLRVW